MRRTLDMPQAFQPAEKVDSVKIYTVDNSIDGIRRITAPAIGITEPGRGIEIVNLTARSFRESNLPDLYGSMHYIVTYPYGEHPGEMFEHAIVSGARKFVDHVWSVDHSQLYLHGLRPVDDFSPAKVLYAIEEVNDNEPPPVSRDRFNRQRMISTVDVSDELVIGGIDLDAFTFHNLSIPLKDPIAA